MKIVSVVGARPNFMKIAPFIKAIHEHNTTEGASIEHVLVHTGQHYDDRMSQAFFEQLSIPKADINLGIGSGSHAQQVGNTMIEFERVLQELKPDWVVVVGDVNATLACSVTAKKEHINCCHIEAGLRSGDIRMPEEVNRLVTDRLSDLLLTPDKISSQNLINEGVPQHKIKFVGNIMIDTLEKQKEQAAQYQIEDIVKKNSVLSSNNNLNAIQNKAFAVVTMHRPSNVDKKEILTPIVHFLTDEVTPVLPIIWTVHPRTRKLLAEFGLIERLEKHDQIILLEPIGYHQMLCLNMNARIVMTDSGGLQEECTVLGTPCLTLRWNTERPITLKEHGGASYLVGNNIEKIRNGFHEAMNKERKPVRPDLWDGETAGRCLEAILNYEP